MNRDKKGPLGKGPRTGRGLGKCKVDGTKSVESFGLGKGKKRKRLRGK